MSEIVVKLWQISIYEKLDCDNKQLSGEYNQRVSYFCKRGNFVSNYVISSHTHSVSVLYNFSSATLCGTYTYFH